MIKSAARSVSTAWAAIDSDQELLSHLFGNAYKKRSRIRAFFLIPGIRAGFYLRCAASEGIVGIVARNKVVTSFGCDISAGAKILGSVYLPHPVGIVIGRGVIVGDGVTIYQGVTLGSDSRAGYPKIGHGASIFPNAIVTGGVAVGEHARIGAGTFVSTDVPSNAVVREDRRRTAVGYEEH
jgi:serine O-acetyltransferase